MHHGNVDFQRTCKQTTALVDKMNVDKIIITKLHPAEVYFRYESYDLKTKSGDYNFLTKGSILVTSFLESVALGWRSITKF